MDELHDNDDQQQVDEEGVSPIKQDPSPAGGDNLLSELQGLSPIDMSKQSST